MVLRDGTKVDNYWCEDCDGKASEDNTNPMGGSRVPA